MQNQCIPKRQLARLGKDVERVLHGRYATCAPRLVPMNAQAVWTRRRNTVLIVMMREVNVVHDILLATSGDAVGVHRIGWLSFAAR